ncbi:MAG TPA: YHYH protein [Pelobium sp.]
MKKKILLSSVIAAAIITVSLSCKKSANAGGNNDSAEIPAIYKRVYGASSITSDGTFITIKTSGLPDHKSEYYAANNPLYEAYTGTTFTGATFRKNPNTISAQNYTFKIPLNPKVNTNHASTPLGPIGVALNGVPFFNQYAGPNQPLTNEVVSFDQYYGHPQQSGQYHYHVEPLYLTRNKFTKAALLGFLLDGFPVYGPEENGKAVANTDLDAYHGHTTVTADYPNGIYHYHITDADPYINGSGFYGTAGTVSQ